MPRTFRRIVFVAMLVLAMPFIGGAPLKAEDLGQSAQGHEDAIKTDAGKFVQVLGDKAIAIIADSKLGHEQRANKFKDMLRNSFDLMTIGRFVIGRTWNAATPDQQKEYINLFEALVVKSYGDKLTLYAGEGFEVISVRPESEKDTIVASQITHPDGSQPTEIDWRVRKRDGKLGIIDVVVEGVSLSVTQRQEYAAVIQNHGGQIDGLLTMMRQQLEAPTDTGKQG